MVNSHKGWQKEDCVGSEPQAHGINPILSETKQCYERNINVEDYVPAE